MAHFQRTGDPAAFHEVMTRSLPSALAVARCTLRDEPSAEDAVQEAFLRVVRRRAAYTAGRSFANWFFAILRNICADTLRARAREARLAAEAAIHLGAARLRPALRSGPEATELLGALPAGERDVLLLRIVHGLSFTEVGTAMGISQEAAKKRAQRGLRRLRGSVLVAQLAGS